MKIRSIRFKASLLYSLILAVILAAFSASVYLTIRTILYQDLDEELKIKAEEISSILYAYEQIERGTPPALSPLFEILRRGGMEATPKMAIDDLWRSQLEVLDLKNDFINILNVRGRTVLNSNNFKGAVVPLFGKNFPFALNGTVYKTLAGKKYKLRAINLPVKFYNTHLIVQVGTPMESIDRILERLLFFMAAAAAVFLVATSFIGAYFARRSLKPVQKVVDLANRITHKDLSERIEEKDADLEMAELIDAFNVMIKRLEASFGHINEFSSYAAHELKTPLAVLRGEIELALGKEKTPGEYRKVLEDCLSEIDRMIKVVRDLLTLAKLDYRPEVFHFEKIDLIPLLAEIGEQSKILAEPKAIAVDFRLPAAPVIISADKVHLRRLFHNIIGNAIKHIPAHRTVAVTAKVKRSTCIIDITDTGDGISEEDLQKLFTKFFRILKDDEQSDAGTGLGLSIALSIARAHRGDIRVRSKLGQGTTFTVFLPTA